MEIPLSVTKPARLLETRQPVRRHFSVWYKFGNSYLESSLMVTVPEETKNLAASPLSSITVTTPGARTANAGTWSGKIPKDPENMG